MVVVKIDQAKIKEQKEALTMVAANTLSSSAYAAVFLLLTAKKLQVSSFQLPAPQTNQRCYSQSSAIQMGVSDRDDFYSWGTRVEGPEGEDQVLFGDDGSDSSDGGNWGAPSATKEKTIASRWGSLNPKIKGEQYPTLTSMQTIHYESVHPSLHMILIICTTPYLQKQTYQPASSRKHKIVPSATKSVENPQRPKNDVYTLNTKKWKNNPKAIYL